MGLSNIFNKIKDVGSKVIKKISDMSNVKSRLHEAMQRFKPVEFKQFNKPDVKPSDMKLKDKLKQMPTTKIKDKLNSIGELSPNADKLKNFKKPPPGVVPMTPAQREAFRKAFNH